MLLLNTSTIQLENSRFGDPEAYAILSHVWGEGEVTFQEFLQNPRPNAVKEKLGYKKIENACVQAASDGFKYIWIDTCCIDKISSSELSEAINSMYLWYQKAEVCYAYLADVPSNEDPHSARGDSAFAKSRWFKRGWTLQELLAPLTVVFYGKDWKEIGTKASLQEIITSVTQIKGSVLLVNNPGSVSVAQRMSWASKRQTSRVEDIAYCLMGIFGVKMPILYGEGNYAFRRLQQEIMKSSDDHTIFAWRGEGSDRGLLATSPDEFAMSSEVQRFDYHKTSSPYSMTNKGVCMQLPLITKPNQLGLVHGILNAQISNYNKPLGIYLKKSENEQEGWVRENTDKLFPVDIHEAASTNPTMIYVKEKDTSRFEVESWMKPKSRYTFDVQSLPSKEKSGYVLNEVYPRDMFHGKLTEGMKLVIKWSGTSGALLFKNNRGEKFIVMLGVCNYSCWSDVVPKHDIHPNEELESVRESYYRNNGRGEMLWRNLDRIIKPLPRTVQRSRSGDWEQINESLQAAEQEVTVAIRKGKGSSDQTNYTVLINVRPHNPSKAPQPPPKLPFQANAQYNFSVKTVNARAHNLVVSELYPTDFWDTHPDQWVLSMGGSRTSGCLMFQNHTTKQNVAAVILGVYNYNVWCDIVTNFMDESVQSIRDSYYKDGGRRAKLWENLKETRKAIGGGSMNIVTRALKEVLGFETTISIM